jgi:hypothetical protein
MEPAKARTEVSQAGRGAVCSGREVVDGRPKRRGCSVVDVHPYLDHASRCTQILRCPFFHCLIAQEILRHCPPVSTPAGVLHLQGALRPAAAGWRPAGGHRPRRRHVGAAATQRTPWHPHRRPGIRASPRIRTCGSGRQRRPRRAYRAKRQRGCWRRLAAEGLCCRGGWCSERSDQQCCGWEGRCWRQRPNKTLSVAATACGPRRCSSSAPRCFLSRRAAVRILRCRQQRHSVGWLGARSSRSSRNCGREA